MAGMQGALRCETDALILQTHRLTLFQDRVRCFQDEASAAIAILDTFGAKYTDLLAEVRALSAGHHAIVECEERAVEFDGALQKLIQISCTGKNFMCPAGSAQSAPLIFASQALRSKPLPLATAHLTKLENLLPIAHAIASCPADLNTCLEKALEKKDILGLALLLADGHADLSEHGSRILVAVIQSGHMELLVQLKQQKGVSRDTLEAVEILLIEDEVARQAAFEVTMRRWMEGTEPAGRERAARIELILALLASTPIQPGAASDELLHYFVYSRDVGAIRTLLTHTRLDPSVDVIMLVARRMARDTSSSAELKHLLLTYANTRPDMDVYAVLDAAIMCKDVAHIRALLANPRINPFGDARLFCQASHTGSVDVVAVLLADGRIDPAGNGNYALHHARSTKNTPLVNLLLADERVKKAAGI